MVNETLLRFGIFVGLFAIFAALEAYAPRRVRRQTRKTRWLTNLSIVVIDSIALRAMAIGAPLLAIGAAIDAQTLGIGVLNIVDLPGWAKIIAAVLFLDFAVWAQHLISHKVPLFWRFHQMHHADRDIDVSTALRFHPFEILASMLLKIGLVYAIGAPPVAVLTFEIILNGTAMFNHANLALPPAVDRALRMVLVTPDMHRVHHSDIRAECDNNYGFALSIWDRIFDTYTAQPKLGHDAMIVGLKKWQNEDPSKLGWSLMLPFRREP
ncbi:MAG: sterol desaturase family protein [Cypionkella sp.]|nr:sterol desaturase family protein [Cypionkella sp.]